MRVVRHRVFIDGDVGAAECCISGAAGEVFVDEVEQHQVVLGAAGDEFVTAREENFGHRLGVIQHLFLVFGEGGVKRFEKGNRLRGNHLHQRPALDAGEDGGVEFFLQRFVGAREDQPAARPAQGFVGGGGDDVGNRYRVRRKPRGDKACDVRHIDHEIRADAVGNFAKALQIQHLRVGGETGDDHLRLVLLGDALHRVVINQPGFQVEAVMHGVIKDAGGADR